MNKISSNTIPEITRLQGYIIIPYCIKQLESGEYEYQEHRILDVGQEFGEEEHRQVLLQLLNQSVNDYIYSHYNSGTQASFLALSVESEAVKVLVQPVWDWIKQVMGYYYQVKASVASSEDFQAATWDFTQFDASDPNVELSSLMVQ